MFTPVAVPTPFEIGPVNTYIAGRTLVDPGPASGEAWSKLLETLEERELAPDDIEQVLITHPHPDHFGITARFRDRGARVLARPETAEIIRDFETRLADEQAFFRDFFERCGIEPKTAETATELPEAFLAYVEDTAVDRRLSDGDVVTVDDEAVTVRHAAGHAPGEAIFAFEGGDGQEAIVGDQVLPDTTPNPFLQPPAESDDRRPRVLPAYNDSLERLAGEDWAHLHPGHGDRIDRPRERIEAIRDEHEKRTGQVAEIVEGPTAPATVMRELFGELPVTEVFPGMSEAVGHLDVLEARGRIERTERGGLIVYEPREQ
ncbi:MAG: MBL fold metallo-hydrolase [Haloarculaceae archaeon]